MSLLDFELNNAIGQTSMKIMLLHLGRHINMVFTFDVGRMSTGIDKSKPPTCGSPSAVCRSTFLLN